MHCNKYIGFCLCGCKNSPVVDKLIVWAAAFQSIIIPETIPDHVFYSGTLQFFN